MLRKNPIENGEKCSVYKVNQLERCDVHRDGTCSVIKPTGLPSADDIWGINLTRRQLRDLSRALLGRLSCYHTDSGNGFHCWRDIRFPKQFHSEVTLLQIHIGWHIRFCTELQKKSISPSFKCLLARFQFWLWSNQSRWFCGGGPMGIEKYGSCVQLSECVVGSVGEKGGWRRRFIQSQLCKALLRIPKLASSLLPTSSF